MASKGLLPLIFAGLLGSVNAYKDDLGVLPETYCVTYVSTFLVPVSATGSEQIFPLPTTSSESISESLPSAADGSSSIALSAAVSVPTEGFSSEDVIVSTTTEPAIETTASEAVAQPTESGPTLLNIVLGVVPNSQDTKRDQRLQRRALGGFVGTDSGLCEDADQFNLLGGSLLSRNSPVYYNGEDYKLLGGQTGPVPPGAITTTFSIDGNGYVQFSNSLLPNGQAGFCQVSDTGEVYLTFTSSPPDCVTIRLAVIGFQECRDQNTPTSSNAIIPTTFPIAPTSIILPSESIPPFSTDAPQTQPFFTSTFRFSNTSATTMGVPVAPTQSSKISFITFDTSAEPTAPSPLPTSESFPTTSALSTELSIFPTLIPLPGTSSRESSTLFGETTLVGPGESSSSTTSTQPPSSFVTEDPVIQSDTTTQSLSTSFSTDIVTTATSQTTVSSSEISTSTIESTTETTTNNESTTETTSNVESVTESTSDVESTTETATNTERTAEATSNAESTTETTSGSDITTESPAETTFNAETTTKTTSNAETTTETTSNIESSTETTSDVVSSTETTSDILTTTTTEALTTSDIESTTTTAEETTTELPPGACGSVLSAPTPIFGTAYSDDDNRQVVSPFAISAFGSSGSNIWVSTNGFVTVNSNAGASSFNNRGLPTNQVAPLSVFAYWDDLAVSGDGQDRIEYEVSGDSGQRTMTINWCVKTLALSNQQSNQFTATFYENDPGIALFRYYKTTQGGTSATVGGQNTDANSFVQYEANQAGSVVDRSFHRPKNGEIAGHEEVGTFWLARGY
ncbi:hypothetical protein FGRMN_6847 [Fusarium graminum]|nr:hypothetical protein FGRMN_6847 [Fusarium graminum]